MAFAAYALYFGNSIHFDLVATLDVKPNDDSPKIILAWNSWFHWKDFQAGGFGRKPFLNQRCPVSNCHLTDDRSRLAEASALLFHARQIVDLPPKRYPSQLYVFFLLESPFTTRKDLRNFTAIFNVTMTHRMDSDIPIQPYFVPIRDIHDFKIRNPYRIKYPFKQRNRSVAWVNSRCLNDQRKAYVDELSKYIDVDVYGECTKTLETALRCQYARCFYDTIPSMYKFFLSFENAFCLDYVSEKIYRTIQTEIVPVVYGGTNYTRDLPPHSFINALDYDSPADLARYLNFLSDNKTEYMKYFAWKGKYRGYDGFDKIFCRLCEIVNDPTFSKRYDDVAGWWNNGTCTCAAGVKRYGFDCVETASYVDVSLSDIKPQGVV